MTDTLSRIQKVAQDIWPFLDGAKLTPEARLKDDVQFHELDCVQLWTCIEEEFAVDISDLEWESVATIGDIVALVDQSTAPDMRVGRA